jgi:hypothetical protein
MDKETSKGYWTSSIAPTILNGDHNQSCVALSHDHKFHAPTNRIEIEYHHICEIIKKGMVK